MEYNEYVLEDFLGDESFQNWRLGRGNTEEHKRWEKWLLANPAKKEMVEQASAILLLFVNKREHLPQEEILAQWNALRNTLESKPAGKTRWLEMPVIRYAAAVALLCVLSAVVYLQFFDKDIQQEFITYESGFGEKQEINLPDGTSIILNANTQLKTLKEWNGQSREVWLENGEAYFSVARQADKSNFMVHTDELKVEVLGTQFNVNLTGRTSVMLDEGSIRLMSSAGGESIMKPGDLAEYNLGRIMISKVDEPKKYTAWLENKISFDNTTLTEISNYIQRHYGVSVMIPDTLLQKRRLSGEIPNDNLDLLLSAISVAMDLSIKKVEGKVVIEKGNN